MKIKTALITGGATGIGKRTAVGLAEKGINLIINYKSSEREALRLADYLSKKYDTKNTIVQGDISRVQDCEKVVSHARNFADNIDILIHNAGPYVHERKRMTDYTEEEWAYIINGNLNTVFYLSKFLIPNMREQKWGRIITIGFDRVETVPGWIYRSAFAAAKSGLASLTKTMALEEVGNGITVNMVCPGDIINEWKEKDISEALLNKDENLQTGRPGTGEDISRVISFLTEDDSGFITGSIINITGGKDVIGKIYNG